MYLTKNKLKCSLQQEQNSATSHAKNRYAETQRKKRKYANKRCILFEEKNATISWLKSRSAGEME